MHKIIIFLFLSFTFNILLSQNRIDSLKTVEDIQNLVDDKEISEFVKVVENVPYEKKYQKFADSIGVKAWTKADFDNDGRTDILINGLLGKELKTICILDKGTYYETQKINKGKLYEEISFTIVKGNKIHYYNYKILNRYGFVSNLLQTKLLYKFGGFLEENPNPKQHNILEIDYSFGGSYGPVNDLHLKIISNKDIEGNSTKFHSFDSNVRKNHYSGKVSTEDFKTLIALINYIDFENLDEKYKVSYTDAATAQLEINYDHLLSKKISDYGMSGTRGLEILYNFLKKISNDKISKTSTTNPESK